MKIFVDDVRECPPGWTLARSITEAIYLISRSNPDEISLDLHITAYHDETFEPVARYIQEKYPVTGPEIWVHSDDPAAILLFRQIMGPSVGYRFYPDEYQQEES